MISMVVTDCVELQKVRNDKRAVAIVPKWARAAFVEGYFGIGYRTLIDMVTNGLVRMRKSGEGKKSMAIFNVADIDEAIDSEWVVVGPKLSSRDSGSPTPPPGQVLPSENEALTANGGVIG